MKILVTGANGFLGSHICRYLHKRGLTVLAVMRQSSSDQYVKKSCHKIIRLDYNDNAAIKTALSDCDAIVHVAAVAKDWGNYSEFHSINVEMAERIHKLAIESGVNKTIHISTNAVLGEEDSLICKKDDAPYKGKYNYLFESVLPSGMNHYKTTKEEAEKRVLSLHKKANTNLFVLRPVWIFGPREFNAGPYEYIKTVLDGIPVMPGCKTNRFHTIYVEDVAKATHLALTSTRIGQHYYNIGPKTVATMDSFYSKLCSAVGKKRPMNIPYWPLVIPVLLLEAFYYLFNIKSAPLLTRARLYMMYANNIYDVTKAERELGFTADTDIDYAIRKTVKWWRLYRYL